LSELTQPGAYAALQALAVDPAMAAHREWLLHLMDAKAETEVDPPAWDPADIAIFATKYETRPRSTSELNQMILWRLEDLRDTVENADFASRNVIEPKMSDEYALQLFVAGELDRDSRGYYSLEREPEVFGRKEPDIRVKVPGLDPVAIEVKWADDWDLKQLVAALTDQLVGRYFRAASSR